MSNAGISVQNRARQLASWVLGPLLALGVGAWVGRSLEPGRDEAFFGMPKSVDPSRNRALEGLVRASVANAAWAFGDGATARRLTQSEIHRLQSAGGSELARAYLRLALVDTNPDGRKALFGQTCAIDAGYCEDLEASLLGEAKARFVAPGSEEWFQLMKVHPPIGNAP